MNEAIYPEDGNGRKNDEIKGATSALLVWSGWHPNHEPCQVPDVLSDKLFPTRWDALESLLGPLPSTTRKKNHLLIPSSFFFFSFMAMAGGALSKAVKTA